MKLDDTTELRSDAATMRYDGAASKFPLSIATQHENCTIEDTFRIKSLTHNPIHDHPPVHPLTVDVEGSQDTQLR